MTRACRHTLTARRCLRQRLPQTPIDDADAQIASQQEQIDQAQETGVDIVASAQAAFDDLSLLAHCSTPPFAVWSVPGRRIQQCAVDCANRLHRFFGWLVAGPVPRRWLAPCGCRALAIDGRPIATDANFVAVQICVSPFQPRLQPSQGALALGQLIALARRPMAGRFVETTLAAVLPPFALVLQLLAFARAALALVGGRLTNVRVVIALIGDAVAAIRRCAESAPGGLPRDRSLGGAALVVDVQLLETSRLLVLVHRLAVQVGGLPVQLAQAGIGRVGHQVLRAFGGCALAASLLARAVAELLRAPSPLTMLLGTWSGHDPTVLCTAVVRYNTRPIRRRSKN
jgi:hypothetical protein